ncbi:MAG: hypothetical protein WAM78_21640 [Candidatus Sulfotelmatobacter sp.]
MQSKTDDAVRLNLLEILQVVRLQQEAIHKLFVKVEAVENVCLSNESFAVEYQQALQQRDTSEQREAFVHALNHLDQLIAALKVPPKTAKPN